ncbi:tryptophan-rich sensory protein [Alsobacter sp. SYSU M60028]|uniref:Tryptophan-rich sensory protein n=1 Tax=Alsobacter ponti TaxID=2962936 RepID=A0ABT1LB51_9HYPH|nr:TspO/MBR family protein [Alsobacter ponti]MCP8938714.1 tryptophan-rich sensory protein [Alsobacter ponti]
MSAQASDRNATSPWLHAVIAVGVVFAAGAIGSAATLPSIPLWYERLAKPAFTPPNWVFGPVWTLLYAMMALAFWRILRLPPDRTRRRQAIMTFATQIVLNALWSVVFFGLRNPPLALAVILALEAAILATLYAFAKLDRVAGWLLAPYPLWVAYATALNAAIVWLNP